MALILTPEERLKRSILLKERWAKEKADAKAAGSTKLPFYLDPGYEKPLIEKIKKRNYKNKDTLIIIDGRTGEGKSTKAQQWGYALSDGKIGMQHVCFSVKEFILAVREAKPYDVIIFDEAYEAFNRETKNSVMALALHKFMILIRQKRLYIILCVMSYYDLPTWVFLDKAYALVHCSLINDYSTGVFKVWSQERIKDLYLSERGGQRGYTRVPCNFYATFTSYMPLNEKEYLSKKNKSLMESTDNLIKDKRLRELFAEPKIPEAIKPEEVKQNEPAGVSASSDNIICSGNNSPGNLPAVLQAEGRASEAAGAATTEEQKGKL